MTNFQSRGQAVESACKAYAFRSKVQSSVKAAKLLNAAILDIERHEVGSAEWKEAVKQHAEIINNN